MESSRSWKFDSYSPSQKISWVFQKSSPVGQIKPPLS